MVLQTGEASGGEKREESQETGGRTSALCLHVV